MQRRGFVKLCATAVAGVAASPKILAEGSQVYHPYGRVALVDPYTKRPVGARALEVGETYLFHYPYISTPCFLLNLGKTMKTSVNLKTRDGNRYRWKGGAGPNRSIVAFSAICAHKMSHPAKSVSFINYRHQEVSFLNSKEQVEKRAGVIYCCSERSVYDPADGCRVLGGPAPEPLAAIELDYDAEQDTFYATATIGGEMFDKYFQSFTDRLILEHGRTDVDAVARDACEIVRLRDFTANQVTCQA